MISYKEILNDTQIINIYNTIKQDKILWGDHSLLHINSVLKNIDKICQIFNIDQKTKELVLIAGVLHDTGVLQGKKGHAERSFEFAKQYLQKFKEISENDKKIILFAIKNHSEISSEHNLETKILVLADKCDITKTRVTQAGMNILGMREYSNINSVDIDIKDNVLVISIHTEPQFNKKEFLEFYFTETLNNAVKNITQSFDLDFKIEII
ncbi:MAG: HD domain-containing protein [Clostridia bacterium]|nr:HD domain-containing protein [Clostridia bacterium]